MICERCGGVNRNDAIICEFCEQPLENKSDFNTQNSDTQQGNFSKKFSKYINLDGVRPVINIYCNNNPQDGFPNPLDSRKPKNKWISFILCLCTVCGHKFYEGRFALGLLYLFTGGIFGIGYIIDLIVLLCKPNPYYVKRR